MPILDGAARADLLPEDHIALLNSYGDELGREAVRYQRETGLPISKLLGVVVDHDEDQVAGIGKASELSTELIESVPPNQRDRLRAFLSREVPLGHLRLVVWNASGIALLRVDTLPMAKGGAS